MELFEARREGYIQALKDLHNDGILPIEELKKREAEQMAKQYTSPFQHTSPFASTIFGSTTMFGGQTSDNSPFGGSTSSTITFATDLNPNPSSFDLRATSNTSTFGSSLNSTIENAAPTFGFGLPSAPTSGSVELNKGVPDEVDKLAAQVQSSSLGASDFVMGSSQFGDTIPSFKITVVGDGGVGKTVWVDRLRTGEFEKKYIATIGVSVQSLKLNTSLGPVNLNVWDVAGQEKFGGIRDGYYIQSHGFVIMFDVTSRLTYKNVPNWYTEIRKENHHQPIVLVGNKVDVRERMVQAKTINFHRKKNLQYYELSVKSCYNIEKPFLHLLRVLTADPNLVFVSANKESSAEQPPTINISKEDIAKYEAELEQAASTRLPDADEDL